MDEKEHQTKYELILALKEAGVDLEKPDDHFLFPTDPKSSRALELMLQQSPLPQTQIDSASADGTVGELRIFAVPNPVRWQDTQSDSSRWLNLAFDGRGWDAVFYDTLDSRGGSTEYPMLYRIESVYEDVIYKADEIEGLREECLRAQAIASEPPAQEGLQKLIFSCDAALAYGTGLYLASD